MEKLSFKLPEMGMQDQKFSQFDNDYELRTRRLFFVTQPSVFQPIIRRTRSFWFHKQRYAWQMNNQIESHWRVGYKFNQ